MLTTMATSSLPRPWIGWRLLALCYDALPALALWLLASLPFTLGYTFLGHHDPHQNIAPGSALSWLLWLCCWLLTGLYASCSWRRGGQTLGMRPWRLRLVSLDGKHPPSWRALWLRYLIGGVSLLCVGAGFWWAWLDPERLCWHDRISRTRLIRLEKPKR